MLCRVFRSLSTRNFFAKSSSSSATLLGLCGLHNPGDFEKLAKAATWRSENSLARFKSCPSLPPEEVVELLDNVSNDLCRVADAAELVRSVHGDEKWVQGAVGAVVEISRFMSEANVEGGYYDGLLRAERSCEHWIKNSECSPREHETFRVLHAMRVAMENEGVNLKTSEKNRLLTLLEEDGKLSFEIVGGGGGSERGSWIRVDNEILGKYGNLFSLLKKRNLGREVFVPVGHPIVNYFMKYCPETQVREKIWKASHGSEEKVNKSIHDLVAIRTELAQIRGYKNWNAYAQRESVLTPFGGVVAVDDFLRNLWMKLMPGLKKELDFMTVSNQGKTVKPWDVEFIRSNLSNDVIDNTMTLSVDKLVSGANVLCERMLGIRLVRNDVPGENWHEDVMRFELHQIGKESEHFPVLYMDLFSRPEKNNQAAQFTISGSKRAIDQPEQIPRTAMILGLPGNLNSSIPATLAVTFFHEFGHCMHSLLSETNFQHFSGSRGAIDFVEFVSHLFEYFVNDAHAVSDIFGVSHSQALEWTKSVKGRFPHFEAAQQLTFAMLDQVVYQGEEISMSWEERIANALPIVQGVDNLEIVTLLNPPRPEGFDHLVHYGGSYYCYLLSRVLASAVWKASFSNGKWAEGGKRLREFLKGGSVEQTLERIFGITNGKLQHNSLSLDALLQELSTDNEPCAAAA